MALLRLPPAVGAWARPSACLTPDLPAPPPRSPAVRTCATLLKFSWEMSWSTAGFPAAAASAPSPPKR